jgi:ribonucleoside-diphosphate reductase beta chain
VLKDVRLNFRPFEYNKAFEFSKSQNDHHWTHSQIEVDSDLMQYNTEFTEAEKHGINTVLKLFTTYETSVGDYWTDVVYRHFPKHEIRMMAQVFAAMEVEHALFYDRLNEALGLSTEDFYLSFLKEPEMKKRMDFIGKQLAKGKEDDNRSVAISLATFSFIEGVVLYSSFAFLMSFQNPPKNKLKNVFTGLSYSVRDEALHASADSWLFNTFVKEYGLRNKRLEDKIKKIANECYLAEENIIDNIFAKGKIEGITDTQLKNFVKSRVNKKLRDVGIDPIYEVNYNPVARWFYRTINQVEMSDFFDRNPTSYNSDWNFGKIKKW